ncbi:hypothetical protein A1D31_34255 [Bradyrhizobium liaoningense]|nr:hypothetical protein A1D31_34255 [Bradyrhizobium liaoningense]
MSRFTDRYVASLKARGTERSEVKDDRCEGLAIRLTASRKTFCFGFKRHGKMKRITLGDYPRISLAWR